MEESFGQWVKDQRLSMGLGPVECARRIGWSHTQWIRQESDSPRRPDGLPPKPRTDTRAKIADALNLPEAEVLQKAGYSASVSRKTYYRDENESMNRSTHAMFVKDNP